MERHLRKKNERDVIQKKLDSLNQQSRETESALARERSTHANLTAKRTKLLEELVGADAATSGWAHGEIDNLDFSLRASSRVAEGLSNSLARINSEKSTVTSEFARAQETCQQEERAQAFSALQTQIRQDKQASETALDAARSALFALNRTAVQGIAECGEAGRNLVTSALEEFKDQQFNPELLGWRDWGFEVFTNLRFQIYPMARK